MRHLSKLATCILLITLSALPAFAAIPCQDGMRSMPCCNKGSMCPALATSSSSLAISRKGMQDVPAPCCKMLARSFAVVIDQQSNDTRIANVNDAVGPLLPSVSRHQVRHIDFRLVNLRHGPRSQAALSTFLI